MISPLDFYLFQDDPAPFIATSNRLIVKYASSVNNIGTGWRAVFEGRNNQSRQIMKGEYYR